MWFTVTRSLGGFLREFANPSLMGIVIGIGGFLREFANPSLIGIVIGIGVFLF